MACPSSVSITLAGEGFSAPLPFLNGVKVASLRYFDSVCRELTNSQGAATYRFYFAMPPDIYNQFSDTIQDFVDKPGVVVVENKPMFRFDLTLDVGLHHHP